VSSALVLGGQGAAGSAVAAAFRVAGWDVEVGGRRPGADRRVDFDRLDTLLEAIRGVDVVVNTVPHPGMAAEVAVLEHGGVLVNVADRSPAERERLRAIRRPAGTVLLNWGVIPGVATLVADRLLARSPDADTIELAVVFSARGTSGTAGGAFLHRELSRTARHRTATIPLPQPFGERRCLEFAEGQEGWLGSAAAGREVRSYVRLAEPGLTPMLFALNRLSLMRVLPRRAFAGRSTEAPSEEPFALGLAARRDDERLAEGSIAGHGMYGRTADVAALGAAALLESDAPRGCLDPHEAFAPGLLDERLREAGLQIEVPG
jgi:hypothetical protein